MEKKRIALLVIVVVMYSVCMYFMNIRFNRLSRYPYKNDRAIKLIDTYLTDEEIDYIIEYSVDYRYFIDYIECKGFRYLGRAFYASNSLNGFVRLPVWKLEELKKEYIPRLEKILETEEKIKREESKLYLILGLILSKATTLTEAVNSLPKELILLVPKYETLWHEAEHTNDDIYLKNIDLFEYYLGMRML